MSNEDMILKVLGEVLEELQTANKSLKKMEEKIRELETRVQAFEQKEIKIEPPDLGPVIEAISVECVGLRKETAAGLTDVAAAVEKQPKPIVRRIMFFPENDTQGNYKTFIRNVVGGILGTFALVIAYVLLNAWILRMHPERAVESTSMKLSTGDPATVPPPALTPARRSGAAISHTRQKKSGKNLDTLDYNEISHIIDSLQKKIEGRR